MLKKIKNKKNDEELSIVLQRTCEPEVSVFLEEVRKIADSSGVEGKTGTSTSATPSRIVDDISIRRWAEISFSGSKKCSELGAQVLHLGPGARARR